ncbi:sulfotransferase [Parvibaculaceae bacterium PLY_AMNH_Bact1]|nr:sulfotransferase [Parvibaculaceae bacterium PLY_AMNH_Bact1]
MKLGFIFSLPRSGSTYVQRVLSGAPSIKTTPEPWLLPALFGIRTGSAPLADFAYDHVRIGISDMLNLLPNGDEVWRSAIAEMTTFLYEHFCENPTDLFLDKTPRNAGFCEDILSAFPDARILFLWRNPLAVVHSINETWGGGQWNAYFYEYDLRKGLPALIECWNAHQSEERVLSICYEDLVSSPQTHWPKIFEHFEAPYSSEFVTNPAKLLSTMGDQTGQQRYIGTSSNSVDSWQTGFGGPLRKHWARRYLEYLGTDALQTMGYDKEVLSEELSAARGNGRLSDAVFIPFGPVYHFIEPYILRNKAWPPSQFARR